MVASCESLPIHNRVGPKCTRESKQNNVGNLHARAINELCIPEERQKSPTTYAGYNTKPTSNVLGWLGVRDWSKLATLRQYWIDQPLKKNYDPISWKKKRAGLNTMLSHLLCRTCFQPSPYPGPGQLSVTSSTVLEATESWPGPGYKATFSQCSSISEDSYQKLKKKKK